MLFRSLYPRALKDQKKDNLAEFWPANKKGVDCKSFSVTCFGNFLSEVESFRRTNN